MAEGQTGLAIKPQVNGQSILRLLILEESSSEAQALIDPLREMGYAVTAARVKSPLEFQAALKKQEWDLIISPFALPNFTAKQALALLAHAKIDVPFIVLSEEVKDDEVTEVLRCGARALIHKNQTEHLQLTVQQELRDLAQRRARHHYEKMFRESERRCQILLESSRNAIACVRNGKVLYFNPSFERLTSNRKEKGIKGILDIIHPDDRQRFEELLQGIETGKNLSDRMELKILDSNGKPLPANLEAMVAHVNEQQCAQVSFAVNTGPSLASTVTPKHEPPQPHKPSSEPKIEKQAAAKERAASGDVDAAMVQKIRDALAADRFRLVYQPIVPLHAQPAENYEVLTRMLDENGVEIAPGNFMPTAEAARLMTDIDRWIIRAAIQTLVKQHSQNKETSLLVKLSEDSLCDQSLVPWISALLQGHHLPGDTLIFEIKEAFILHRLDETTQIINGLKQLHCRTALGHFGADPQSLDCLEQLRVNFVKLAANFVDNLSEDAKSQAMVRAVVQTAHDLGTQTIAAFVQDASKMATLWQCNVDFIQGYFLQAPDEDMSYNFSDDE